MTRAELMRRQLQKALRWHGNDYLLASGRPCHVAFCICRNNGYHSGVAVVFVHDVIVERYPYSRRRCEHHRRQMFPSLKRMRPGWPNNMSRGALVRDNAQPLAFRNFMKDVRTCFRPFGRRTAFWDFNSSRHPRPNLYIVDPSKPLLRRTGINGLPAASRSLLEIRRFVEPHCLLAVEAPRPVMTSTVI